MRNIIRQTKHVTPSWATTRRAVSHSYIHFILFNTLKYKLISSKDRLLMVPVYFTPRTGHGGLFLIFYCISVRVGADGVFLTGFLTILILIMWFFLWFLFVVKIVLVYKQIIVVF